METIFKYFKDISVHFFKKDCAGKKKNKFNHINKNTKDWLVNIIVALKGR